MATPRRDELLALLTRDGPMTAMEVAKAMGYADMRTAHKLISKARPAVHIAGWEPKVGKPGLPAPQWAAGQKRDRPRPPPAGQKAAQDRWRKKNRAVTNAKQRPAHRPLWLQGLL